MKASLPALMLVLALISSAAFAVKEGGGGDVIQCDVGTLSMIINPFSAIAKLHKDTYLADLGALHTAYMSYNVFTTDDIKEGLLSLMRSAQPAEASELEASIAELHFNFVGKLEELDTGLVVPRKAVVWAGCKKKQIAVQNFDTHQVNIDDNLRKMLVTYEQVLLVFHEAYVNIEHRKTTDLATIETRARARVGIFGYPSHAMEQAIIDAHFSGRSAPLSHDVASEVAHQCGGKMGDAAYFIEPFPGVAPTSPFSREIGFVPHVSVDDMVDDWHAHVQWSYFDTIARYSACLRGTLEKLGVFCTSDIFVAPTTESYTISKVGFSLQKCSASAGFSATSQDVKRARKASRH